MKIMPGASLRLHRAKKRKLSLTSSLVLVNPLSCQRFSDQLQLKLELCGKPKSPFLGLDLPLG